mmetsp:Transcript_28839/g.60707  ORF Transcript_28839/g.60707 Transcript_28839/m.60707 type:complete len:113 (-) Transcript_28839:1137-1475(-)
MILSNIDNSDPNSFKCAIAGKMTLTIIVQINPTNEHKKLNDGKKMATASDKTMSMIFTNESINSMAKSLGNMPVSISSKPSANGNIVSVNLLIAVRIISHVSIVIRVFPFSD